MILTSRLEASNQTIKTSSALLNQTTMDIILRFSLNSPPTDKWDSTSWRKNMEFAVKMIWRKKATIQAIQRQGEGQGAHGKLIPHPRRESECRRKLMGYVLGTIRVFLCQRPTVSVRTGFLRRDATATWARRSESLNALRYGSHLAVIEGRGWKVYRIEGTENSSNGGRGDDDSKWPRSLLVQRLWKLLKIKTFCIAFQCSCSRKYNTIHPMSLICVAYNVCIGTSGGHAIPKVDQYESHSRYPAQNSIVYNISSLWRLVLADAVMFCNWQVDFLQTSPLSSLFLALLSWSA